MEVTVYIESDNREMLDFLEFFFKPETRPDFEEDILEQYKIFFKKFQYIDYPNTYERKTNNLVVCWNWLETDVKQLFTILSWLKPDKLMGTLRHPELATEEWETAMIMLVFKDSHLLHVKTSSISEDELYGNIEGSNNKNEMLTFYFEAFSNLDNAITSNVTVTYKELC